MSARVPFSAEYRHWYERGWRYALSPSSTLEHGDAMNAPAGWYDGYLDQAAGREKWDLPRNRGEWPNSSPSTSCTARRGSATTEALEMTEQATSCLSCGEDMPRNECPNSKRACGHHCDCSWEQDRCCWCGAVFGDVDDPDSGKPKR